MAPFVIELTAESTRDFQGDLRVLSGLPKDVLAAIPNWVDPDWGLAYSVSGKDAAEQFLGRAGLGIESLESALKPLRYTLQLAAEKDATAEEAVDALHEFARRNDIENLGNAEPFLPSLLQILPRYKKRVQLSPYARGLMTSLESVGGTVELRAGFPEVASEEILGFVPVAYLTFSLKADGDRPRQTFNFQVNPIELQYVIEQLQIIERKLSAVTKYAEERLEFVDSLSRV